MIMQISSYFVYNRIWIDVMIFCDYYLVIRKIDDITSELYFRNLFQLYIIVPAKVVVTLSNSNEIVPFSKKNSLYLLSHESYTITINENCTFLIT